MPPVQVNELIGRDDQGYFDLATGAALTMEEASQISSVNGLDWDIQTFGGTSGIGAVIDPATNQANLNAAARQAAASVGLTDKPKGDWSQAEAVAYVSAFKAIILANPAQFSPLSHQIAQHIDPARYYFDNEGPIDPNAFVLATTDVIAWAGNQIVDTYGGATSAIHDVANGFVEAIAGVGKSAAVFGAVAPLILPAAAVLFLWFAVRTVGGDPGGQLGKTIGAFR